MALINKKETGDQKPSRSFAVKQIAIIRCPEWGISIDSAFAAGTKVLPD